MRKSLVSHEKRVKSNDKNDKRVLSIFAAPQLIFFSVINCLTMKWNRVNERMDSAWGKSRWRPSRHCQNNHERRVHSTLSLNPIHLPLSLDLDRLHRCSHIFQEVIDTVGQSHKTLHPRTGHTLWINTEVPFQTPSIHTGKTYPSPISLMWYRSIAGWGQWWIPSFSLVP